MIDKNAKRIDLSEWSLKGEGQIKALDKDSPLSALVLLPIAQKEGGFKPTSRLKLLGRIILRKPLI
jgi:hypothetical protein